VVRQRIETCELPEETHMQTAQELFIHNLNDMLDAERRILEVLQQQEDESDRSDMQKIFAQHHEQTEKQIERLQQCFLELDEEPEETECHGVLGLIEEKQSFMQEEPTKELIDLFNIGATGKVEHYEIAVYESLIDMAEKMEQKKVARLLQQNLREEEQMLRKCQGLMKKFKPSQMGMEEEEEQEEAKPRRQSRRAA
jgi:ferritin-like metal-binding protein YciE